MLESAEDKVYNNGVIIERKQFGKKLRRHAKDYGLNPSKEEDRKKIEDIIQDIVKNRDEILRGMWRGQGEKLENGERDEGIVNFIIKGNDVVIAKNGVSISILKDGVLHNTRIKKLLKKRVKK